MTTETKPLTPIAAAWVAFIDTCRAEGHELPGNANDLAQYAADALEILDPDNPHYSSDWDSPAHELLCQTFCIVVGDLHDAGIESTEPEPYPGEDFPAV